MSDVKRFFLNTFSFIKKFILLFRTDSKIETDKFIIAQKSCPHCASRGMFIFNSSTKTKNSNGKPNENKT